MNHFLSRVATGHRFNGSLMRAACCFLLLLWQTAQAGNGLIGGCVSVDVGAGTCRYTVNSAANYVAWRFTATGGTVVTQNKSGTVYTADISFDTPGTQTVKFVANGNTTYDSYAVAVSGCPGTPTVGNRSLCGSGTVTLTASTTSWAVVRWYDASGSYLATGNTFTTPYLSATTIYKVDAYYAPENCASSKVNVTATLYDLPGLMGSASASPNNFCGTRSVTLSATGAAPGENYVWTDASNNEVTSPVDISATSTFSVARRNTSSGCVGPETSTTITVDTTPRAYTMGGGGTFCIFDPSPPVTLSGSQSEIKYVLTKNGTTNSTTVQGTGGPLIWTNLSGGRYTITGRSEHGACSLTMTGSIGVNPVPSSAGGSISPVAAYAYGVASGMLTVSGYTGTIVQWEKYNGTTWEAIAGTAGATQYAYSNLAANTDFRVQVQSSVCPAAYSNTVTVNVYQEPTLQTTRTVITYGGTAILSTGNYDSYQWSLNGKYIPGANQSRYEAHGPGSYTVTVQGNPSAPAITTGQLEITTATAAHYNLESTTVVRVPGVQTSDGNLFALKPEELAQTITYSDGMGRPHQVIAIGQTPAGNDLVQYMEYAETGLSEKHYLPYATPDRDGQERADPVTEQAAFYSGGADKVAINSAPYAVSKLADSPLANLREQGAPGTDWQPGAHSVKTDLTLNTARQVRYWLPTGTTNAYYPANTLTVNQVTDENGNKVRTFTDKLGQTVLKQVQVAQSAQTVTWLETYYVYDDFGNLVYQLSPKAMAHLGTASALDANKASIASMIYKYTYDNAGRLTAKKVPSAVAQYFIYDAYDRPVLMQDGNLRSANAWFFVKYDSRDRVVMTGRYKDATHTTRESLQQYIDELSPAPAAYEEEGTAAYGYTNQSFPQTNDDGSSLAVHAVNYYDHYDFDRDGQADYAYAVAGLDGEMSPALYVQGKPTGHMTLVEGTSNGITTVAFYDAYGHVIQRRSNSHLSPVMNNLVTAVYDLEGKVRFTKTEHNAGGSSVTLEGSYHYDPAGRLTEIYQTIPGVTDQLVARYEYNELGLLVDKKLHGTDAGVFMQSIDYRYNERGWLQSINNAQLSDTNNDDNDANPDYFGMDMVYTEIEDGNSLNNTPYWNGNISVIKWSNPGHATGTAGQRSYKYTYDKSDRLTDATFQANVGTTTWTLEAGTLNEQMTYDANGNIMTLHRYANQRGFGNGVVTSTPQAIDNLTYTYRSQTDQLQKVEDATANAAGFTNGKTTANEYVFTDDGSLKADQNKGIKEITYNVLGKPKTITYTDGRKLEYTYDLDGNKLTVKTYAAHRTTPASTIDYVNGFVYENGALSYFGSPEGRVVKKGNRYEFQYAVTDHQGNTRVMFSATTPEPQPVSATFETAGNDFNNYPTGATLSTLPLYDHTGTAGSSKSQLLNGGLHGVVGLAKSYKVYPGDKLKIEAYAKYFNPQTNNSNLGAFASDLTKAFNVFATSTGEALRAYTGLNTFGSFIAAGNGGGTQDYPKAFVTILLFDQNHNFLDIAADQIDGGEQVGVSPKAMHDFLSKEYTVKEAGYAYVYISNETPTQVDVYFDDVTMTYTPTNILQVNEYYPYGLQTASSWTREGNSNNFLYNGGTEQNTTTGLYDLAFRNFDPALGRFHQIDPLADSYSSLTPYNYANGNPALFNDPNGLGPPGSEAEAPVFDNSFIKDYSGGGQMYEPGFSLINYTPWVGGHITPGSGGNWADGIYNSDWSLHGGSQSYRGNRAMGATDLGGRQYYIGSGGARRAAATNGNVGYYEDYNYTEWKYFFDDEGNLRRSPTIVASQRFVAAYPQQSGIMVEYNEDGMETTTQAFRAYFSGRGLPARIGINATRDLINSEDFLARHQRIVSGQTTSMTGNFSVDLTSVDVFIGRTNVDYTISCASGSCTVTYDLFVRDGFWDVDFIDENFQGTGVFQPDGLGPNLERMGGMPFPFIPVKGTFKFPNPGYK